MTTTTTHDSSRLLWRVSARQHGVVTRAQLLEHGLSAEGIRHRLREGRLHRRSRGVYAVGRHEVSREGLWMAATLSCGRGAALSHSSAAALWGIRRQRAGAIVHVSVPRVFERRRPGVQVHRVDLTGDVVQRDGISVVSPGRTLLNQAAVVSRRELEADINAADIHGLITPADLRRAATRYRGMAGVVALREVLDQHTFRLTDSELERLFLPLPARAGLAMPSTRRTVNGLRVDFFWPDLGLVVETDGLRYHRTPRSRPGT